MKELSGKVSLVTGGTRGIGRAVVLALADAGSDIVFSYAQSKDAAQELSTLVESKGVRCRAYQANVAVAEEVDTMVRDAVTAMGPIGILVNNAGITRDKTFLKMSRANWDEVMQVNLNGVFNVTHAVLPDMAEAGWGRIINVSSIVGQTGNYGQANYAASKGAVLAFTKTLAREVARKNITVNAVAPGFIETDMTKNVPEAALAQVKAMTPAGRLGKPEEIADAILFLASPRSAYITGQVLAVNGGMYI